MIAVDDIIIALVMLVFVWHWTVCTVHLIYLTVEHRVVHSINTSVKCLFVDWLTEYVHKCMLTVWYDIVEFYVPLNTV